MTDDKLAPRALPEKGSDTTFLRETIGFAAERLMRLETDTRCDAGRQNLAPAPVVRPPSVRRRRTSHWD